MVTTLKILLCLLLFATPAYAQIFESNKNHTFNTHDLIINDGDIFTKNGTSYRFSGMNTFEIGQKCVDKDAQLHDCGLAAKKSPYRHIKPERNT